LIGEFAVGNTVGMTDLYSRRRRARKLANGELEKSEDDEADASDLEPIDHAGVVEKVADDLDDDRAEELVKSLRGATGGDDDVAKALRRHNIFAGERTDLDLEPLDYSDLGKTSKERDREALARELADELERRGVTAAGNDEEEGGEVEKDATDDLSAEVEEWANAVEKFVEDRRGAA
jgi:hypothetical protein